MVSRERGASSTCSLVCVSVAMMSELYNESSRE